MARPTAIYSQAVQAINVGAVKLAVGPKVGEQGIIRARIAHSAAGGASVFVSNIPAMLQGTGPVGAGVQSGYQIPSGQEREFYLTPGQALYAVTDSATPVIVSIHAFDDTIEIVGWNDLLRGMAALWEAITGRRAA